jgi:alginate O-acetyltransferase complex protein AlgJ
MEMETTTAAIGSSKEDRRASLINSLVGINAALWLALLGFSFAVGMPAALRYEKSSNLTLVDGKLAHDFEKFVTRHHPYRDVSLNSWAALDLKAFGTGKTGVVVGSEGWMFTSEEFPLPSLRERVLTKNLEQVRTMVEALHRKGIEVLIVPIPGKAELYSEHVPEHLRGHIFPASQVTDYLTQHRIPWVPVKDILDRARRDGKEVFFRSETHWTPEGAQRTAAGVTQWLAAHGKTTWHATSFQVTSAGQKTLESDLESFIPVRPTYADLLPPAETYTAYRVVRTNASNDAASLFSDAANPVALVGTSYSADERWNFTGWLRAMLRTEIDNVSEKAKGPFVPMEKFLAMHDAGKTAAHLVIWEMPVRSMAIDYNPHKGHYAP